MCRWITLLVFFFCVQGADAETRTVYVKNDSSVSFEWYTSGDSAEGWQRRPCLFFFEPWGNGALPVERYRVLAERYGFSLIGFNGSRNGMDFDSSLSRFNLAWQELLRTYKINPELFCVAGFSGGSKVALKALESASFIRYGIYGGAVTDVYLPQKEVLGFAGTLDMNYGDLLEFDSYLNSKPALRHFIIEYEGPHAWFDTATFENAFVWMKLNLIRNGWIRDTAFVLHVAHQYLQEIDSCVRQKEFMQAGAIASKALFFLSGVTNTDVFASRKQMIGSTSGFKKEIKQKQQVLEEEKQVKSNYPVYFFSRDTAWWKGEIERLNHPRAALQVFSFRRIASFIRLSCYYNAMEAFSLNNLAAVEKIVSLFRLAAPKSPEPAFLFAVYWAKKADWKKSDAWLEQAKQLGFTEWDKKPDENILQYFGRRPLK
jgi:hypothetical protein